MRRTWFSEVELLGGGKAQRRFFSLPVNYWRHPAGQTYYWPHTAPRFWPKHAEKVQLNHKSSTHFPLFRAVSVYIQSEYTFRSFSSHMSSNSSPAFSATHSSESLPASAVKAFSFSPTATMLPLFLTAPVSHIAHMHLYWRLRATRTYKLYARVL